MGAPARFRALLIGNNHYDDPSLDPLRGPEQETDAIRAALTDGDWGLFDAADVRAMASPGVDELRSELGRSSRMRRRTTCCCCSSAGTESTG